MAYALQDEKIRDTRLLKMLDRGIDDMEAGRECPLTEAFVKITELRIMLVKRRDNFKAV